MSLQRLVVLTAAMSLLGLAAGCSVHPDPKSAVRVDQPHTPAAKTFTSFTPALRCMDDLMIAYGKRGIPLTTTGIDDFSGKTKTGTKEMLIRAVNEMSRKSGAFKFIDYDAKLGGIGVLDRFDTEFDRSKKLVAFYYIRGAITQLDDNAVSSQAGGSVATPWGDLGLTSDQIVSLITVDLNIGDAETRQILAYTGSSNTLAVVRNGLEGEAGGKIGGKAGFNINVSLDKAEGLGAAVRALIELGAIEVIGQFTQTPYWKCLQIEKTNPKMMESANDWFEAMPPKDLISFVQRKLMSDGLYNGPVDGQNNPETKDAVSRYQAAHNLIADGRVSFEVYYALLDDNTPLAGGNPALLPDSALQKTPVVSIPVKILSSQGAEPVYRKNDILEASVKVGGKAFVYCYYQDYSGTIAPLFPNRFQSDRYVTNGGFVLSSERHPVKIRFDNPGHERIACFATSRDVSLPKSLQVPDGKPLGSVDTLDQVGALFRNADPSVSSDRMEIVVR